MVLETITALITLYLTLSPTVTMSYIAHNTQPGAPKAGGQEVQLPSLPFNFLKTRGPRGQIVLFKISISDKYFLVMLYNKLI